MRAGIVAKESAACLVCEAINSLAEDIKNKIMVTAMNLLDVCYTFMFLVCGLEVFPKWLNVDLNLFSSLCSLSPLYVWFWSGR